MRSRGELKTHCAFTLIELLVVVAIIATLIAVLVPSLGRARQQAYQVKCAANLKSIGLGMFYYVHDPANGNGFLPNLGYGRWASQILWALQIAPYLKLQRGGGVFRCPSDPSPPYVILNGPSAGSILPRFVGNAPPQPRLLGPLIEPISYAPSRNNTTSYIGSGGDTKMIPRKLTELDRPYCQTLLSEIYNEHAVFHWRYGIEFGWDNPHGDPGTGREAWRHYGGKDPNRNGSNWLFADGHVQWHSVASLEKLFCCQDFPRGTSVYEYQAQRCGGGATTRRR